MDTEASGNMTAQNGNMTTRRAWGDRDEGSEDEGMKIRVTGWKICRAKRVIDETGWDNATQTGEGLKVDNPENLDGFILAGTSKCSEKKKQVWSRPPRHRYTMEEEETPQENSATKQPQSKQLKSNLKK